MKRKLGLLFSAVAGTSFVIAPTKVVSDQINHSLNERIQSVNNNEKASSLSNYTISDQNGITVDSENFVATSQKSDGIGIGPRGYLILDETSGEYKYIGYDGKIIWTRSIDSYQGGSQKPKSIYVDYNENLQIFVAVHVSINNDSNNPDDLCISFINESDGSRITKYNSIESLNSDFYHNNWKDLMVTRIQGTNGYYVIPKLETKISGMKVYNFFINTGKKEVDTTTGENNTVVRWSNDNYHFSRKVSSLRATDAVSRIIAAGAVYHNNTYNLVTAQYWPTSKKITVNTYANETYKNDFVVLENADSGTVLKFENQINEIFLSTWGTAASDFVFVYNSTDKCWILRGALYFDTGNKHTVDNISLDDNNTLDFDAYSGRLYNRTYFLYGQVHNSNTSIRGKNKILRFVTNQYRSMTQSSFNYQSGTQNSSLTSIITVPQTITQSPDTFSYSVGIMPTYTSSLNTFDSTLGLIGINSEWSQNRNSIITIDKNGNYTYNTQLTNQEIYLEGLQNTLAHAVTEQTIKSKLTVNNLLNNFTAFKRNSTVTVTITKNNTAESQTLYSQGKIKGTVKLSGCFNGTTSISEKTFDVIFTGFKTISQTSTKVNEISVNGSLASKSVDQTNESEILTWVRDNYTSIFDEETLPYQFAKNNITSISIKSKYSYEGSINIGININSHYNNSSYLSSSKEFALKLKGFKSKDLQTTVNSNTSVSNDNSLSTLIPSSVSETKIKEIIVNNLLVNAPLSLSTSDITSINYTINNLQGTITISQIIVNKYQDSNGNLVNSSKTFNGNYVINGFKVGDLQTTVKANTSVSGDSSLSTLIPSSVTEDKIKEIIVSNLLTNAPANLSASDVTSINYTINNSQGTITISQITVNKYQDSNGNVVNSSKTFNGSYVINGFKVGDLQTTVKANTSVSGNSSLSTLIPSSVTEDKIKEIIVSNLLTNAPANLSASDITSINYTIDNSQGTITISQIIVNKYQDSNGNLVNSSKTFNGSYVISGFQTGDLQTTVKANTSISGDNSLSTLIPSSVTETKIKEIIVNNLLVNSPANLSASDVTSVNYTINNSQGTITISQIIVNKYQDSNGNVVNSSKTFNGSYVINGFKIGDLQTTINPNTSVSGDSSLSTLIPSSVTETKIKEIIVSNLLTNAPANLSASDVTSINYTIDNSQGTITISQIIVNKYQDSNGSVVNSSKTFNGNYVISGFQTGDLQTTVKANTSVSGNSSLSTLIPSSVTEDKIKEIIVNSLLTNAPANLSTSDVTSINYTIDNSQGTITISQITVNKYQDSNGSVVNSSKTFNGSYVINGFQTGDLQTTVKANTSVSGDSSLSTLIPSSVTEDKIKEIIVSNLLTNAPANLSASDVTSINYTINNSQGTITISQITVNKYQDSNGNVVNSSKTFNGSYVINGFKIGDLQTTINPNTSVSGDNSLSTLIPSSVTEAKIKEIIISNLLANSPVNFSVDNITSINYTIDNLRGTITISQIIVNKYQDSNGNLVNSSKTFNGSYVISGFQTGDLQTTINPNTSVSGDNSLSTLIPSNVTEAKIKEIIVNNLLANSPVNFSVDNITSVDYTVDNLRGTITISQIIVNKYQDSNGNLVNSSKTFNGSYVISGFQTGDLQTTINPNTSVSGDNSLSTLIPSNVTEAKIKEIIVNNLLANSPVNFSVDNITSVNYTIDNLRGTITISQIIVNKYQDSNGNVVNSSKTFNGNYVISGFAVIKATSVDKNSIEAKGLDNFTVENITENDLKKWVYDNRNSIFHNLPANFTEDNIEVSIVYKDSQKGSIVISIILDNFYDDNGNINTGAKRQFGVTLTNFKTISETTPSSSKLEIPLWIWAAIGGGVLFLIIILIIIIASKKKNKNKRKSPQNNRPSLSPPPIGINQQNKIGFNNLNNNKSISNNQKTNVKSIPPARKVPNVKTQNIGTQVNNTVNKNTTNRQIPPQNKINVNSPKTYLPKIKH